MSVIKPCVGKQPRLGGAYRGFTLVEVLVTIIVLALGLLGLAGLQALSLKNNHVAYYRSIASQQASDMQDRMRANLGSAATGGVIGGSYDNMTTTIPADPGCFSSGCALASQMATTDQYQWLTADAALLSGGTGTVRCVLGPAGSGCVATTGNTRVFDVTLMWVEKDMGDTGATTSDANCPAGTAPNTRCFVTRFSP